MEGCNWELTEIFFFSTASGRKEEIRVAREMFSLRAPSSDSRAKSDDFRAARARWRDTDRDFFNYFGNSTRWHCRVVFQGCMSRGGRRRPSYDDLFIAAAARVELPALHSCVVSPHHYGKCFCIYNFHLSQTESYLFLVFIAKVMLFFYFRKLCDTH